MDVNAILRGVDSVHVVQPLSKYNGLPVPHHTSTGKNVTLHNRSVVGGGRVHPNYPNNSPLHVAVENEPWLRLNHYIIKSVNCFKIKIQNVIDEGHRERYSFGRFKQHDNLCNIEDTTIQSKI